MKSIPKFIACLILCFGAAAIGGLFTQSSVNTWYAQLTNPEFSPPNWVFAPVWNVLYFLMAVSLYHIWVSGKEKGKTVAMTVFMVQLVMNVSWSAVFFGMRSPSGGFSMIIVLLLAIVGTIFSFSRISAKSACFLLPYLIWVCFAGYLNYHLWVLN